jgi:hypothetical protein
VNPFKELLFLQGHVTQPTLLRDAEASSPEALPLRRPTPRPPVRLVAPALPVGGCG